MMEFFKMHFSKVNIILDGIVRGVYRHRLIGSKYHPYFLANDVGKLSVAVGAVGFILKTNETTVGRFLSTLFLTFLGYRAFTQIKGRVFGIWSRSYLQDLVIFVAPWVIFLSFLFEIPIPTALDLMGFLLPLYIFFVRLGCFFGGCCYGIPSQLGVLYPDDLFAPVRGFRNFSPGPNPQRRVLPTQLLEALFNGCIFCLFWRWFLIDRPASRGTIFFVYLALYGAFRFCIDFFRVTSSRPRIGRFSEAQIFGLTLSLLSLGVLAWIRHSK